MIRLGEKITRSVKDHDAGASMPDLADLLLSGEGPANIIPGEVTSDAFPVIVVHSIAMSHLHHSLVYHRPEYCLNKLIDCLVRRIESRISTPLVKVLLDEMNPFIFKKLMDVNEHCYQIGAILQVDLFVGDDVFPVEFDMPIEMAVRNKKIV